MPASLLPTTPIPTTLQDSTADNPSHSLITTHILSHYLTTKSCSQQRRHQAEAVVPLAAEEETDANNLAKSPAVAVVHRTRGAIAAKRKYTLLRYSK